MVLEICSMKMLLYKEDDIVNYVNTQDAITMVNGENHIGETYSVPNLGKWFKGKHDAEGMGKLSEREKITTEEMKDIADEKFNPHKTLRNGIIYTADTFEKMEKLRNRIKQEIEEEELRRQIELRKFRHSKI